MSSTFQISLPDGDTELLQKVMKTRKDLVKLVPKDAAKILLMERVKELAGDA